MIFGFMFLDIIAFALIPFLILITVLNDKEEIATFLIGVMMLIFFFTEPIPGFWSKLGNPVFVGNILMWTLGYAAVGGLVAILRFKLVSGRIGRSFVEYVRNATLPPALSKGATVEQFVHALDHQVYRFLSDWPGDSTNIIRVTVGKGSVERLDGRAWELEMFNEPIAASAIKWKVSVNSRAIYGYVSSWIVFWPCHLISILLGDLIGSIISAIARNIKQSLEKALAEAFSVK